MIVQICTESQERVKMFLLGFRRRLIVKRENFAKRVRDFRSGGNFEAVKLAAQECNRRTRSELAFGKRHSEIEFVQDCHNFVKVCEAFRRRVADYNEIVKVYRSDNEDETGVTVMFDTLLLRMTEVDEASAQAELIAQEERERSCDPYHRLERETVPTTTDMHMEVEVSYLRTSDQIPSSGARIFIALRPRQLESVRYRFSND